MKTIAPSIKRLVASGICRNNKRGLSEIECAQIVRNIIHGIDAAFVELNRGNPIDGNSYPATESWVNSCHHRPKSQDIKLAMMSELLGMFGVEAILGDGFPPTCHLEYLNAGDTYAATIIRFPGGRYAVSSWGDEVERLERNGVTIP